jgi:hypothetical protein
MTTLNKKIGDFTLVHGGADVGFFKQAMADITATTDINEWIEEIENGRIDEFGKLITLYDYKDGGIGSVYVEVQPLGDLDDYDMCYMVYTEYDGFVDEVGAIRIGNEADLVNALNDTILATTKEFAEKK